MGKRGNASLIPYRRDGTILLQHRTEDAKNNPGFWACFGGGIEEGETPVQALQRELFEELEYRVKLPPLLLAENTYEQKGQQITSYDYIEEFDESQTIVLHEGQGYGWFTVEEALKLKITERRRRTLLKVKEFLSELLAV